MKLVTYRSGRSGRPGALLGSGAILDLRHALQSNGDEPLWSIAELFARGPEALQQAAEVVAKLDDDASPAVEQGWVVSADEAQLLGPTGHNPTLLSVGGLYADHLREMGVKDIGRMKYMSALRTANAIIGSGEPIVLPAAAPDMVDYEGEFSLVVGSRMHQVDAADVMDHIVGYTINNDVGARDYCQPFSDGVNAPEGPSAQAMTRNLLYKEFPTFSPLGPCIVTADEVDLESLVMETTLNGEIMQHQRVAETAYPIADAIAAATQVYVLIPGDVVTLGTPAGVGFARNPQRFLRPGDEIAVTVEGIGSLRNPVVAAA